MDQVFQTPSKKTITLDARLGSGGEGEVWTVKERLDVAKLYHSHALKPEHEQKILAMVSNPPEDKMRLKNHVSIAWPNDALYQKNKFAGFLMPRIVSSPTIFSMYNPKRRQQECPGFNWKYLMHTALNLSIAVDAIHLKNYVIGDLNESNVLVKPNALVSLIDTDSFQVKDGTRIFRCRVGKEDFLPPELMGVNLDKVDRLPEHDYYGLGVLIFRLLMEGVHPFTGVLKKDIELTESTQLFCQKMGAFPYDKSNPVIQPPVMAPRFEILPASIQQLMRLCFIEGHKTPAKRPSAGEWVDALEDAEKNLVICSKNKEHLYSNHLKKCPWCERENLARVNSNKLQTALPPAKNSRSQPQAQAIPAPALTPAAIPPAPAPAAAQTPPARGTFSHLPPRLANLPARLPGLPNFSAAGLRRAVPPARSLRAFFTSAGLSLGWDLWWRNVWRYLLGGAAGGLLLSGLIYFFFVYTAYASIAVGVLAGAAILGASGLLARFLNRQKYYYVRISAIIVLILGVILSVGLGAEVRRLTAEFLAGYHPQMSWVVVESLEAGILWGGMAGSYRIIARRKSPALASALAVCLALIPVGVFWLLSKWGLP